VADGRPIAPFDAGGAGLVSVMRAKILPALVLK
jgi:hypothetical protein